MYLGEKCQCVFIFHPWLETTKLSSLHFTSSLIVPNRTVMPYVATPATPVSWLAHGHHRQILILWALDAESETF